MSYGLSGDEDPAFVAPETECVCGDILQEDGYGEWACPSCTDKDKQEVQG